MCFFSLSERNSHHTHNTTKVLRYQQQKTQFQCTSPAPQMLLQHTKIAEIYSKNFDFVDINILCTCLWYAQFILGIEKY